MIKQFPVHPRAVVEEKVEFIKQVPGHSRNRLKRVTKQQQKEVGFMEQVPLDPKARLKRKDK